MAEVIRGTTLITCPFCKSEKTDSHEWKWHGIHRCDDCRGYFQWNRIEHVTYTTEPVGEDPLHGEQEVVKEDQPGFAATNGERRLDCGKVDSTNPSSEVNS